MPHSHHDVRFRVLGPIEAWVGGHRVPVTGRRAATVLAGLLLEWDRPVPLDALVRFVWDDPPATARKQVQNLVGELRRQLAVAGADGLVETHPAGYRLRVRPGELDLAVFEDRLAAARSARGQGRPQAAVEALREALAAWRGAPLAGLSGPGVEPAATRLTERRLAALEDCAQLELDLGHHHELVPVLTTAVADNPFRERLRAQLMVALYRSGRQADALAHYRAARTLLVEELGIEPGPELSRTEHAILVGDPALDPPAPDAASPPGTPGRSGAGADLGAERPASGLPRCSRRSAASAAAASGGGVPPSSSPTTLSRCRRRHRP